MSPRGKTVHLILRYEYYDAIERGDKTVEYRDNTRFWRGRIRGKERVTFHRGYTSTTMTFRILRLVIPPEIGLFKIRIHLGERIS